MALVTDTQGFGTGFFSAIDRIRTTFTTFRARRAAYLRTFNELNSLSDRELNDLGLSRTDIVGVARSAAN